MGFGKLPWNTPPWVQGVMVFSVVLLVAWRRPHIHSQREEYSELMVA